MTIYAIAHNKGGSGKTTSAVHIVGELKPDEGVDLDTHGGLSVIHALRPEDKRIPIHIPESQSELVDILTPYVNSDRVLFIDCGRFDSDLTRTAIAFADVVIVPVKDSLTERIGLMKFDMVLAEVSKIIGRHFTAYVFLAKTNPTKKNFPKIYAILPQLKHIKMLNARLSYRPIDFEETIESGFGITESVHGRSTEGEKEVIALVEEFKTLV
ncbi:TPA: ParA family protein [Yersinia enterocolitica]